MCPRPHVKKHPLIAREVDWDVDSLGETFITNIVRLAREGFDVPVVTTKDFRAYEVLWLLSKCPPLLDDEARFQIQGPRHPIDVCYVGE